MHIVFDRRRGPGGQRPETAEWVQSMTDGGNGTPDVWFTNRDGNQAGPFDTAEVQRQFTSGALRPGDAVWRAGWPDWYPAGEVFKQLIVPPPMRAFAPPPQQQQPQQQHPATDSSGDDGTGRIVGKVTLIGRTVTMHRFTGTVMASHRSSKTTVSGGTNNQPVTSHTVHTNELFVRLADDSERTFDVEPAGISVRPGNTLTFLLGTAEGKENGFYTTVWNHDTRQLGHLGPGIAKMAGPPFYILMYTALGIAALGGLLLSFGKGGRFELSLLFWLSILGTIGLFVLTQVNRSRLRSAMANALADLRR